MNKVDLNRKIQLLEQQIKTLLVINHNLTNCECVECAKIRKSKRGNLMQSFTFLQQALDGLGHKYY